MRKECGNFFLTKDNRNDLQIDQLQIIVSIPRISMLEKGLFIKSSSY